ncbi:MAG TPA: hypothetical protein PK200_13460, partial [Spirochaetota bacterium]|nr:hypothetical protein [Spirochaetota bacterium]
TAHVWQRDAITLTITGDGMNEMKIDIPPSQVTYSVEVPAGENRLFTVIATNLNVKNSGGSAVSSLTSGQEAQISIKMKPIVQDFFVTGGSSTATLEWSAILNISGYKIYRSTSPDGDYTLIKTINDYTTGITSDGPPSVGTYYYKMKIFDADGDGEFCDYKPATIM